MPKFMIQASYTSVGVKGLLEDGGSKRAAMATAVAQSLNGSIESIYFAFGSDDIYVIADMPSHSEAAAISLAVSASGAVNSRVTVLLTPEEIDTAAATVKGSVVYSPPGS